MTNERDELVPYIGNDYPEYFICGPMIFTPVRREHFYNLYLGYGIVDGSPVGLHINDERAFEGQEYVVLAATFLWVVVGFTSAGFLWIAMSRDLVSAHGSAVVRSVELGFEVAGLVAWVVILGAALTGRGDES